MKNMLWIVVVATLCLFVAFEGTCQAEEKIHFRPLLHAVSDKTPGWSLAGWAVMPDAATSDDWFAIAGARYKGADGWIEFMAGPRKLGETMVPMLDVRGGGKLSQTLRVFGILDVIDPRGTPKAYWFAQLDTTLPKGIGLIGVETENLHKPGSDALAVGLHYVRPIRNHAVTTWVQFPQRAEPRYGVRLLINF